MKVEVNNAECFTCRAAGEGSLDGRTFVNNSGDFINSEGSSRRASREASGNSRVDQSDDTPSGSVGGRKVNSVRGKDVT